MSGTGDFPAVGARVHHRRWGATGVVLGTSPSDPDDEVSVLFDEPPVDRRSRWAIVKTRNLDILEPEPEETVFRDESGEGPPWGTPVEGNIGGMAFTGFDYGRVAYFREATWPISVKGLGGLSVAEAQALRDQLTAAIRDAVAGA